MMRVRTASAAETRELGKAIEPLLGPGDVLLLSGDLGAGKTTFLQGLGAALGVAARITSPTFTLAHTYEGRLRVHHLDLYRLRSPDELLDLDLADLLGDEESIVVVEWEELLAGDLPPDFLRIRLELGTEDDAPETRWLGFEAFGPSWTRRFPRLLSLLRRPARD